MDELLGDLRRLGVPEAQSTLMRVEVLGRSSGGMDEAGLVWEDVLGLAARNSRPIARYLAFMFAAGVIACFGVVLYSELLIVGAMAISPDLLPITAVGVGLVDRHLRLAGRALATLKTWPPYWTGVSQSPHRPTQARCPGFPAFRRRFMIIPFGANTWRSDRSSSSASQIRFETAPARTANRPYGHRRGATRPPPSLVKSPSGVPPSASTPKTADQPEQDS